MKILSLIVLTFFAVAGGESPEVSDIESLELIKTVIRKYNDTEALKMRVKKEVTLSLLEQTKTSEGYLYFSKGLMRLEVQKPEKSLVVLNKEAIWVETSVEGFEGPEVHVTKIASKALKKRSKAPMVVLMTDPDSWDVFKVTGVQRSENSRTLSLVPKKEGAYPEMSKVKISVNINTNELWYIAYTDELDNEVKYKFQRPDFKADVAKSKFKYKPPKGAEVVVY